MGPLRRGAGRSPLGSQQGSGSWPTETLIPSFASSPLILGQPERGFSRPRRRMSSCTSRSIGGRPPTEPPRKVHFLRTGSRCQRSSVCGLTRSADQRALGKIRLVAAMNSRSRRRRRGLLRWRLRTASWWRSTASSTSSWNVLSDVADSRSRRRSSRYRNAKITKRTSRETEVRFYETPGRAGDRGFLSPSGHQPEQATQQQIRNGEEHGQTSFEMEGPIIRNRRPPQ